jgi:hypothetical protein
MMKTGDDGDPRWRSGGPINERGEPTGHALEELLSQRGIHVGVELRGVPSSGSWMGSVTCTTFIGATLGCGFLLLPAAQQCSL